MLCDKADVDVRAISDLMRNHASTIDFNMADRLLCAMGMYHEWVRDEELRELYYSVSLDRQQCHNPGCVKLVPDREEFCSLLCAEGRQKGKSVENDRRLGGKCRKGHERTPENTYERPNGSITCLTCKHERYDRIYTGGRPRRRQALTPATA